jgi:cysteinyl-tRNA synthetase
MSIYFYNSLSRKKEEFKPIKKGQVGLYTCGPTVYSYPHIGNFVSYLYWDILKRFLQSQKYQVKHIMNITDVGHLTSDADEGEDKMEKAKVREGKSAWEIADYYIDIFQQDARSLNILPATKTLRATKTIKEQIAFVKILEQKGFLYKTADGLYFDTSKIKDYGVLGNLQNVDLQEGARVEKNNEKKNITDFAVWKFSPKNSQRDMEWESPWGTGFPGWHLECSVMSRLTLGDTFDIHTGGMDHLTVHHPNEMAQSEAVTGKLQANYWLHNAFMKFDGQKMSKSLGNITTVSDLVKKNISPLSYRYLLLQNNYRTPLNFSWESLEAAQNGLQNIIKNIISFAKATKVNQKYLADFYEALSDDLNTAKALAVLQQLLASKEDGGVKLATLYKIDEVLGLDLKNLKNKALKIPKEAQSLLKQRQQARVEKNYKLSDELRDKLKDLGVEVEDTSTGQQAMNTRL